jgi:hypothetical protein
VKPFHQITALPAATAGKFFGENLMDKFTPPNYLTISQLYA